MVVQTGYMSYYPAVQALEAAVHSDKFTEIQRITMSSNYAFTDVSELVPFLRLVADVPHNRVSPPLQIMLFRSSVIINVLSEIKIGQLLSISNRFSRVNR